MSGIGLVLARMSAALERAGIPFMIAGSFASTTHGLPRATQDLDVVIDPPDIAAIEALLREFPEAAYYFDRDAALDAFRRRSMFNLIDQETGWKVDFIIRKRRAFSEGEFSRRQRITLAGVDVFVATAEDTIIAKLEWSRQSGGSERQRRDVAGILATSRENLDGAYLQRWVAELQLAGEWKTACETEPIG